jgi:hypothetical protein
MLIAGAAAQKRQRATQLTVIGLARNIIAQVLFALKGR